MTNHVTIRTIPRRIASASNRTRCMQQRQSGRMQVSRLDGDAPEATDYANYFYTYSFLYHQKDMLEDHKRTSAYFNACLKNQAVFEGKVVLDVGTGSGILAIFAAKAGARKVYAVEATDMAKFAKRLIASQGYSDRIEVIQGVIESVEIPEKVDIIISEWMGYFLLRESMLDSVIVARDRFLKPGGALYPSHARMYMAPVRTTLTASKNLAFLNSMEDWSGFIRDMKSYYNVSMESLSEDYRREQLEYFTRTGQWADVHPESLIGEPAVIKSYDLETVTLEELKAPLMSEFSMGLDTDGPVEGFCGWFDTDFSGSEEMPAEWLSTLSTAPDETGATHWGQQLFQVSPNLMGRSGSKIVCAFEMRRRKDNQRLLEIDMEYHVEGDDVEATSAVPTKVRYVIE